MASASPVSGLTQAGASIFNTIGSLLNNRTQLELAKTNELQSTTDYYRSIEGAYYNNYATQNTTKVFVIVAGIVILILMAFLLNKQK